MYTTRNGEGSPSLSEKYFRAKYTAKWSVQIAGMLFQTRSSLPKGEIMEKDTTQFTKSEHTAARRHSLGNILVYLLLTIWALVVLFPFYWMLLTSVKSYSSYNAEHIPTFFTLTPTLQNYADAFTAVPLGKYLLNTLIFTVATTAIMMVVITLSAFAFARLEFRGKNLAFTLFLSLMMIPNELVIITNFVTITNLDMRNTFL